MSFPEEIINRLKESGVAAGFSIENVDHAVPLTRALMNGGISAIELTLRTPESMEGLKVICQEVPEMLIGVGTILTPETVAEVKQAGADFGVAPGLNPGVVRAAQEIGLPFAPGIATPSDIEQAVGLGCRFVKFFPAKALGGVAYLRSMSAPYKHLGVQYFPLGGINSENMMEYLDQSNVVAVGGSWIVNKELLVNEDWDAITARAQEVSSQVKSAANV